MSNFTIEVVEEEELKKPKIEKEEKEEKEVKKEKKVTRPRWGKAKYTSHPISMVVNNSVMQLVNSTVLKEYKNKITFEEIQETQVGQAVAYTLDYYIPNLDYDNPIMIMIGAGIGLGALITSKQQSDKVDVKTADPIKDEYAIRSKKQ